MDKKKITAKMTRTHTEARGERRLVVDLGVGVAKESPEGEAEAVAIRVTLDDGASAGLVFVPSMATGLLQALTAIKEEYPDVFDEIEDGGEEPAGKTWQKAE